MAKTRSQASTPRTFENLDHGGALEGTLAEREIELLARIGRRIERGQFELPHLPSTSTALINMASKPSVDIKDLVVMIGADPVLSSELLKTANSALYGAQEPAETISQAVVRIGLRSLRTMILSISMRGAILRDKGLSNYAEEVWRQSYSVASIARAIAKPLRADPEKAFLLGLLADIGKVSLLAMLRRELQPNVSLSSALIGRLFQRYHEIAGEALARAWHLPDEIVSVAGCHHRFLENTKNPRSAALVSLAHKLDLYLSLDSEPDYRNLVHAPEMDHLQLTDEQRHAVITIAQSTFEQHAAASAAAGSPAV